MSEYFPKYSVVYFEGSPRTHVVVDTDIWVSYDAFTGMSIGEILVHITEFLTWLKTYESVDIDPNKIRHNGKNVMTSTLSFSYNRPSTDEEVAEYWRDKELAKKERKAHLLKQLEELES